MACNRNQSLFLLSALLLLETFSFGSQPDVTEPKRAESKTGITLSESINPFGDKAELQAKIRLIDRASPSLKWFTLHEVTKKDQGYVSYLASESLIRTMGLAKVEKEAIEQVFRSRSTIHSTNLQPLNSARFRERDLKFLDAGFPPPLLKYSGVKRLEDDEIAILLKAYEEAELLAETELLEQLHEVLPPLKFEQLVDFWLNASNLYSPLAKDYLQLSHAQVEKIRSATYEKLALEFSLRESVRSEKNMDVRNRVLISSEAWHELYFKPFSYLDIDQFQRAKRLLKGWEKNITFQERIDILTHANSISARAELTVLGELYREGSLLK